MTRIAQSLELYQELMGILEAQRKVFRQRRVFQRVVLLLLGELMTLARHTVTQVLFSLGHVDRDWSGWYRLFSRGRFPYQALRREVLAETLRHVGEEEVYVVVGDETQTPRSSRKIEGVSWLRHPRTAVFRAGIHRAQRWFHGAWLVPAEEGYSRAVPLWWEPAFTEKAQVRVVRPQRTWEAALAFLHWLREEMARLGRPQQRILMVADGGYDRLKLWASLPERVILLVRTAKNRVLWTLPGPGARKNRRYGERAPTPRAEWRERQGWQRYVLEVRGRKRHLQVKVRGPYLRRGAPQRPLFLLVVRGKRTPRGRREPMAFLVNGVWRQGRWEMPLGVEELLFWAWQRWEIEVTHRELKTTFGLGHKQCWSPRGAILSVQWSAWVYALLVLAGYRTWGLTRGPKPPTRWWRGSRRWSLATLWRSYQAALWGEHIFSQVTLDDLATCQDLSWLNQLVRNAAFAAAYT